MCRATQDGRVMVESSDKTWSTGEGKGKPLQYSCLENPMNSMKRQKDRTLNDECPRSVGAQYATGERNGKPFQYSCLENPRNSMRRQKDRTLKEELSRSVGAQYAVRDQWRNNSRKNEEMEQKQKTTPSCGCA